MYITNWQFVNKYLSNISNINEVLDMLDIVKKLLKKYSRNLKNENIISIISWENKNIADFIKSLSLYWKLNISNIVIIERLIKKTNTGYKKQFKVLSDYENINIIDNTLKDKFWSIDINKENVLEKWVTVIWEWNYYKRVLSNDLDKLLK